MVGSWQMSSMTIPQQFAAFADAYLDSASRLCKVLKRSTRKATYERGAVVLYLTFHSIELFLKATVLQKSPDEQLSHKIEHYEKRYRKLYPGKEYIFEIPFKTEYLGFEPPEIATLQLSEPPQDQVHRYPTDKNRKKWDGIFAFDPVAFLPVIEQLQNDFARINAKILTVNQPLQRTGKNAAALRESQ